MFKKYTKFILCFVFIYISFVINANLILKDTIYTQADQMPYFKGCETLPNGTVEKRNCSNQNLINYIAQNLKAPQNSDATGVVYVSFVVDENGKVLEAAILRGLEKAQDEAALKVVKDMPDWQPALVKGQSVKVKMNLPIRFTEKDEFANGFQIFWGAIKGKQVAKNDLIKALSANITIRDEMGNVLEIAELVFEREREGKFIDEQSNGTINDSMQKLVKKLKSGDVFTVTATVQKKGNFQYVERQFSVIE
jgi:TonB family protein